MKDYYSHKHTFGKKYQYITTLCMCDYKIKDVVPNRWNRADAHGEQQRNKKLVGVKIFQPNFARVTYMYQVG
jgi:hypothetical protein